VLALAIAWAYASLRIDSDYRQTLEMERNRLRSVAAALEAGTQAMINDGVGAALAGANAVMSSSGDMDLVSGDRRSAALAKMFTGGEYVRSLFLYSPARFARADRDGTQEASGVAPPWLQLPRTALTGVTWVGKPIADPEAPGGIVIPIARHIITADRDGLWGGALFEFDAFADMYRRFGRDLRIMGIIAYDGTVLAIVPAGVAPGLQPGTNVADNELFRRAMREPESGVVEGFGSGLQREMLYGYQRVNGFDMTIFAGQTRDAILAPWRDRRRTTLIVTGAASALILAITWMLGLHVATSRRAKEAEDAHVRRVQRQTDALLAFGNRQGSGGWTDVRDALREICQQACDVLETDRVAAWKLEKGDRLRCVEYFESKGRRHQDGFEIDVADVASFLEAVRHERVIHVPDAQADPRTSELKGAMVVAEAVGIIAAPVRCSGHLAGVVLFEQLGTARKWYADEVGFASGVADQIAQAYLDVERGQVLLELRRTASELMRLQDEERRRIGRDLHDSTGQTLAALELSLSRLAGIRTFGEEQRELLQQCVELANRCSAEIRTASYLLHPPLLDELGLLSALRWLADGFHDRSGIEVHLDLPSTMTRLSRDEELTLFRVAQEALTNIHRHADSPWAAIRYAEHEDAVVLEIEDGGTGAEGMDSVSTGTFPLGVGLAGMRERIRQVGGTFGVESGRSGTIVRASLPLSRGAMSEKLSA
jgi:signal transduction histidine kinase